jgi:hypothetical protein
MAQEVSAHDVFQKAFRLSELTALEFADRYHLPKQQMRLWISGKNPPRIYLAELLLRVVSLERELGALPIIRETPAEKSERMAAERTPLLRETKARQRQ